MTERRLPAEWEPQQAVLMAWPHADTDWAYMLDEVERCYTDICTPLSRHARLIIIAPDTERPRKILTDAGADIQSIFFLDAPTNDTWTRDSGPITTLSPDGSPRLHDFCFNAWGMKFAANLDNLVNRRLHFAGLMPTGSYRNSLGFVLEGGSIESDGAGTILTTCECLLSPNRNPQMSRHEISQYLKRVFGARKVLWLEHGSLEGDDTDSHIDTLARLAPHNTIIYVGCDDPADAHFTELQAMEADLRAMHNADGEPFNLIRLPLPDPVFDEDGARLPATYANFLIINDAVFLPVYGQKKKDYLASQILRIAFPDHEIIPVDCRALVRQHGSLHCATMQLPAINL